MRRIYLFIYASAALFASLPALANECWAISNIKGYSAYSDEAYKFDKDGLKFSGLVCFTAEGGTVTGTDTKFVKFGESTLAGFGGNDRGLALIEVYQIDREKKKLLYVRSRIGTKTEAPMFSDVVSSFVGDATKVSK